MAVDEEIAGYRDVVPDNAKPGVQTPRVSHQSASPELRALLGIAIAALVTSALYLGKDVFIPITLATVLSFVLTPLVDLLQRARLWRGPAVFLSVVSALGIIGLVGTLIGSQAASLAEQAPRYAQTIESKIQGLETMASTRIARLTGHDLAGHALGQTSTQTGSPARSAAPPRQSAASQAAPAPSDKGETTSPLTIARMLVGPILGPLETTVIVFVVAIFVLMQKEDLRDRFVRLFGAQDLYRTTLAIDEGARRLSRYFVAQLFVNSSFGVVIGLGLWAIGIPSAAMWGVLAGLLRFVPYIGSFMAALAPMALAAAIEPGWSSTLYVALLFGLTEPLTGYALEPMLYGHSTGLSPISVIVAALFWTWLWGPVGLIMSTPLTLCLVVTGRHVKSLAFFDVLLGDRPALTPVEMFYQRLLAAHGDAMLACAQATLHKATLMEFYDEVALPALQRAVQDRLSGRMDEERYHAIDASMRQLIETLDQPSDMPEQSGKTVLCVAGQGPFDGALADMLAQLVRANGMMAHVQVWPEGGAAITPDAEPISAVVLCQADLASTPPIQGPMKEQLAKAYPGATVDGGFGKAAGRMPHAHRVFSGLSQAVAALI